MFKLLSGCITSTDNLITIHTDQPQEATVFGKITLIPSKTEITVQFTKKSSTVYVARLRIDPELLTEIEEATISLQIVSASFSKNYPKQPLSVDKAHIKQSLCKVKYKEVEELKQQLWRLEEVLRALTEGRALTKLTLQNTDCVAPGMVPVAVDASGTFIAAYPFNDMIKDINGVTPVGSSLRLFAEDIPLDSGISLQDAWAAFVQTTSKILGYITTIENQLSSINTKIKELDTALATHINTGII